MSDKSEGFLIQYNLRINHENLKFGSSGVVWNGEAYIDSEEFSIGAASEPMILLPGSVTLGQIYNIWDGDFLCIPVIFRGFINFRDGEYQDFSIENVSVIDYEYNHRVKSESVSPVAKYLVDLFYESIKILVNLNVSVGEE